MLTTKISFDTILPIWQDKLWPNRQSAIEPVSAMTWPFEGSCGTSMQLKTDWVDYIDMARFRCLRWHTNAIKWNW